jgi:hypothetical protein
MYKMHIFIIFHFSDKKTWKLHDLPKVQTHIIHIKIYVKCILALEFSDKMPLSQSSRDTVDKNSALRNKRNLGQESIIPGTWEAEARRS